MDLHLDASLAVLLLEMEVPAAVFGCLHTTNFHE
jgi:hypothetical protein